MPGRTPAAIAAVALQLSWPFAREGVLDIAQPGLGGRAWIRASTGARPHRSRGRPSASARFLLEIVGGAHETPSSVSPGVRLLQAGRRFVLCANQVGGSRLPCRGQEAPQSALSVTSHTAHVNAEAGEPPPFQGGQIDASSGDRASRNSFQGCRPFSPRRASCGNGDGFLARRTTTSRSPPVRETGGRRADQPASKPRRWYSRSK